MLKRYLFCVLFFIPFSAYSVTSQEACVSKVSQVTAFHGLTPECVVSRTQVGVCQYGARIPYCNSGPACQSEANWALSVVYSYSGSCEVNSLTGQIPAYPTSSQRVFVQCPSGQVYSGGLTGSCSVAITCPVGSTKTANGQSCIANPDFTCPNPITSTSVCYLTNKCRTGSHPDLAAGVCLLDSTVNVQTDCPDSLKDRMSWDPVIKLCTGNSLPRAQSCSDGFIPAVGIDSATSCIASFDCKAPSILQSGVCYKDTANTQSSNVDGTFDPVADTLKSAADAAVAKANQAVSTAKSASDGFTSASTSLQVAAQKAQDVAVQTKLSADSSAAAAAASAAADASARATAASDSYAASQGYAAKASTAASLVNPVNQASSRPFKDAAEQYANLASDYAGYSQQGASNANGPVLGSFSGLGSLPDSNVNNGDGQTNSSYSLGSSPSFSQSAARLSAAISAFRSQQLTGFYSVSTVALSSCPPLVLSTGSSWFGQLQTDWHCQLIHNNASFIDAAVKAFWTITAVFIFIAA